MTDTEDTKQISVAELLARNGSIGSPAGTRRRRRRRGDDSVSVAELTGEIPVVRDDRQPQEPPVPPAAAARVAEPVPAPVEHRVAAPTPPAEAAAAAPAKPVEPDAKAAYWAEPEPRWPKSEPAARRTPGPQRSEYPRPLRHAGNSGDGPQSGAEHMSPDPVGHYTDSSVDVMDSEVRDPETVVEDSAYVRSYLHGSDDEETEDGTLFGGQSIADEVARRRREPAPAAPAAPQDEYEDEDRAGAAASGRMAAVGRGLLVVLQSILAVVFGAGLFVAFEELWRWDAIVALVLSVLVILGLVVAVRVVRKTEDIGSTLIAVAVGALITLGPMALLQTS
ncbi:hypothetical protein Mkiyose1665_21410 [Mycobacterium kiyosense]|uniref:Transmembrane protein n=3 Tax=Mycobacterium kiyosense TaxID=2871094 RepID=A0A9P3UWZ2_9MYCO|nr:MULTISPECIES: hypothetical protein [Mycobacterium]BDE12200.1 hypothetical protein MKCMC460_10600 [Mycobacterium sp. 20KCMC460]GLB95085.1 hypothetical protein SRL2020226_18610 [Mycobacterium kiyosense]GLC01812.1 hypothetical protein SRL2020400_24030 [Mycobacterium kiyosense]GLC07317.1 hypothetical protein SRL2020411_19630 [Mycobacterium kiyosense]GLC13605.1 hypothetical protein SRL2020448_22080 [Mycobacterium kiyosense]